MGPPTEKTKRSAKARAARVHFSSSRSPTQSIPSGKCRCPVSRLRSQHLATAWSGSPTGYSRASTSRPAPAASARAAALVQRRRRDERGSMRERAVFIGSISVLDTIGTLPPPHLEIVTLFRLAYCCVMGRKAPRKRLAYRVMIRPTGVPPSTRTFLGAPPTPRFGVNEAKLRIPGRGKRAAGTRWAV
jgi:hypothetical protein